MPEMRWCSGTKHTLRIFSSPEVANLSYMHAEITPDLCPGQALCFNSRSLTSLLFKKHKAHCDCIGKTYPRVFTHPPFARQRYVTFESGDKSSQSIVPGVVCFYAPSLSKASRV